MYNGKQMRLGLCCIFREEDIKFKSRKAGYIQKLAKDEQLDRLSTSILHNAASLMRALEYCAGHDIGSFRINSQILPLKSHPTVGYKLSELPQSRLIFDLFEACRVFRQTRKIRLTFHPDQFTLLSSPREEVTFQSVQELLYHAEMAELVGADVITLHGGGGYGDKAKTIERLERNIDKLPDSIRSRLALENDERVYAPQDLLPLCERTGVPLVYDVHHHRCLPDGLSIEDVTRRAVKTWDREPLFHLSSPKHGWEAKDIRSHHDYINPADIPGLWRELDLTVDVEAKAKELAIARLQYDLAHTLHAA